MAMSNRIEKAMVLAAGEGTRLKPLTSETPKTLLPVDGIPLIQYILAWLKGYGICQVAMNVHHLADQIKERLGNGSQFGMEIHYSPEETLLGTAGGVKKMAHFVDSTFVVIHGDMLIDFDLADMISFHQTKKALITIVLLEVPNPWEYGIVRVQEDGRIVSFVEKPLRGTEPGNLSNGGIYILEKEVLDYIPDKGTHDFAYGIFPKLIALDLSVYGYQPRPEDYLLDIGTISKYQQANEDVRARKLKASPLRIL